MHGSVLRILVVEDSKADALLLSHHLRASGHGVAFGLVQTEVEMAAALAREPWEVVIADYSLPGFTALDALQVVRRSGLDLPFIIVSGTIGEDVAVDAMRAGAHDYILKNNLTRLLPAIEREVKEAGERAARRRAEMALAHQALHDDLTDLPNRHLLNDRLQQAILSAQRQHGALALLVMDLDRFKEINDTFGHHCGDILLQQVAERLVGLVRAADTVARLGGDEFAVILPGARTAHEAQLTAQKILAGLEPAFVVSGQTLDVGASVGVVCWPQHGQDAETLLRHGDVAMYAAKRGRIGSVIYSPFDDEHTPDRLALLGELRTAIEQNQLVLHYQIKVSATESEGRLVEALVRWNHPQRGLLMPDMFIPLAEQTGVISSLGKWVLNAALKQCRQWQEQGLRVGVAVNLSMHDLHDSTLPQTIDQLLRKHHVAPQQLVLEITESSLMTNAGRAADIAREVSQVGVSISIDDFGTGYSSLAYLKRLSVHELKIDRSFVSNMANDASDAAIVQSTIELGHNLGLRVVAEGVEDSDTWRRLAGLGCDLGQGYFLGRPMAAGDLQQILRRRWSEL